jgi:hypothetical protein
MTVESSHSLEEVVTPAIARPAFSPPPSFEEPKALGQEENLPVDAANLTEVLRYHRHLRHFSPLSEMV